MLLYIIYIYGKREREKERKRSSSPRPDVGCEYSAARKSRPPPRIRITRAVKAR